VNSLAKILSQTPNIVARRLLGSYLVRTIDGSEVIAKIVETEAYDQSDPASHSYRGKTPRTDVMFGPPGHLYVYFTYGMHHCMNIVVGEKGHGAAVLIRALEPVSGIDLIKANRQNITDEHQLTNGPGKVCQALAIGREFRGHDLNKKPIKLIIKPPLARSQILSSTRIGISQATRLKWRFYVKDNPYVSRYKKQAL
jgi:DNA-3-methyladenine glycosylase